MRGAEGSGLGIRDAEGLSVKVMVVAGRAAGGAAALRGTFLTTTLRFTVSFLVSIGSSTPKSRPSRKSSSSTMGFGLGRDSGDVSRGGVDSKDNGVKTLGEDGMSKTGAEVGASSRLCRAGCGETSGVL